MPSLPGGVVRAVERSAAFSGECGGGRRPPRELSAPAPVDVDGAGLWCPASRCCCCSASCSSKASRVLAAATPPRTRDRGVEAGAVGGGTGSDAVCRPPTATPLLLLLVPKSNATSRSRLFRSARGVAAIVAEPPARSSPASREVVRAGGGTPAPAAAPAAPGGGRMGGTGGDLICVPPSVRGLATAVCRWPSPTTPSSGSTDSDAGVATPPSPPPPTPAAARWPPPAPPTAKRVLRGEVAAVVVAVDGERGSEAGVSAVGGCSRASAGDRAVAAASMRRRPPSVKFGGGSRRAVDT